MERARLFENTPMPLWQLPRYLRHNPPVAALWRGWRTCAIVTVAVLVAPSWLSGIDLVQTLALGAVVLFAMGVSLVFLIGIVQDEVLTRIERRVGQPT